MGKHARGTSPFLKSIVKEGFVEIKRKRGYTSVWCILWPERLCVYGKRRKDGSTRGLNKPIDSITIADLERVDIGTNDNGYFVFSLRIRGGGGSAAQSLYFGCKEESERKSWVSLIQQRIVDMEAGKVSR